MRTLLAIGASLVLSTSGWSWPGQREQTPEEKAASAERAAKAKADREEWLQKNGKEPGVTIIHDKDGETVLQYRKLKEGKGAYHVGRRGEVKIEFEARSFEAWKLWQHAGSKGGPESQPHDSSMARRKKQQKAERRIEKDRLEEEKAADKARQKKLNKMNPQEQQAYVLSNHGKETSEKAKPKDVNIYSMRKSKSNLIAPVRRALRDMVVGDEWEIYIPPTGGDAGNMLDSIVVYNVELLDVIGDESRGDIVWASSCHFATLDNCKERESKFIQKMRPGGELDREAVKQNRARLMTMIEKHHEGIQLINPDQMGWAQARIGMCERLLDTEIVKEVEIPDSDDDDDGEQTVAVESFKDEM